MKKSNKKNISFYLTNENIQKVEEISQKLNIKRSVLLNNLLSKLDEQTIISIIKDEDKQREETNNIQDNDEDKIFEFYPEKLKEKISSTVNKISNFFNEIFDNKVKDSQIDNLFKNIDDFFTSLFKEEETNKENIQEKKNLSKEEVEIIRKELYKKLHELLKKIEEKESKEETCSKKNPTDEIKKEEETKETNINNKKEELE